MDLSDFTHFVSLASNTEAGKSRKLNVECMKKQKQNKNKQANKQEKAKETAL